MGQGALSKPVVQWWLSLNSSTCAALVPDVVRVVVGSVALLEALRPFSGILACQASCAPFSGTRGRSTSILPRR